MRKSRLLIAVLAATMFVLAAFGFVACDKDAGDPVGGTTGGGGGGGNNTTSYTITFNYGTGSGTPASAKTVNGKVTLPTPTPPANHTNKGWYTAATGGTPVTAATTFNKDTTIYAQYTENGSQNQTEYDITFSAGEHGTLVGTASVKTNNGIATFPTVNAATGWNHTGWKDGDGNTVSASTKFTKSTTVTAQYTAQQQQGGDDVFADAVTIDTSAEDQGYMVAVSSPNKGVEMTFDAGEFGDQYVLENYHLDKDVVIKFQNGTGSVERTTISGGTAAGCFEATAGGIKVVKSGTYTFYVKTGEDEIYVNGSPDFENVDGDTITVTVTCANGTITFVIEKDGDKTPHLHGWTGGGDLFTGWPGKELSDGETVDLSTYNMGDLGLIVNYGEGNAQTQDIKNLSGGNVTITVSKTGGHKIG
ncbi:MAG: InlB B-repeat-containing protein [Clostridiales bacterium]|nr:InlB B-repeat-containing protein [Clostridiales bacterium]